MDEPNPKPGKLETFLDNVGRRNDFFDLQDMNGATCGARQSRLLMSYDNWSRIPPTPSSSQGRHVDGLARFRQASAP